MEIPHFLKKDGDSLVFNTDGELIFYIPEIYFTRSNAIITGEYVNLIGIMDYALFDKNGKSGGLKPFRFPTVFLTKPTSIEKVKGVKLTANTPKDDYRFLKYSKGSQVVVSTKVPKSIQNVEEFYGLFLCGHLPTTIPYDKLHEYFTESIDLNGSSYNISLQMFGVIISEMCRAANDQNIPFRLSKSTDNTAYSAINIREIPKLISSFSSITSENWDNAVTNAIIMKDKKVEPSPMEKLMMENQLQ